MVNSKGWIRILEASIAIIIVFGVLLVLNQNNKPANSIDLTEKISPVLEEIASNNTLRGDIINADTAEQKTAVEEEINTFVAGKIKDPSLNYNSRICDLNESLCPLNPYPNAEVFAGERVISSTLDKIEPKKIKIFLWKK